MTARVRCGPGARKPVEQGGEEQDLDPLGVLCLPGPHSEVNRNHEMPRRSSTSGLHLYDLTAAECTQFCKV